MGMDICVGKYLKLQSGKRYYMGTVELPYHNGTGLLNPELWYQKECYFLVNWCERNLTQIAPPREGEEDEWELTRADVYHLIDDCNKCLAYEGKPNECEVWNVAYQAFNMEEWAKNKYGENASKLFDDLRKVTASIVYVLQEIDDPDVLFAVSYSS